MTTEHNKSLVRRYYDEIWSKGNFALAEELMTPDYVNEDPITPGRCMKGRDGLAALIGNYRAAFAPLTMTITEQWAVGDTVISKWVGVGTHSAAALGVEPTGKPGRTEGVTISQIRDGRIARDYVVWDALGLRMQIAS